MLYHLSYSRMPSADIVGSSRRGSRFALPVGRNRESRRRTRGDYLGGMIWK